ncbi:hypothetical protein J5N97_009195 [Dioscorea zingiberensis]|uniref:Uncharacterized protein n=1 Tax=Dioscorea zingiberensis TaxID=325984 RepID=A0A9D5HL81_9LILI|nr:hypothetical protein J5N97_009195 [Dioscorea zingiberensis]
MAAAFTLDLPRFMVLSSNDRNDYMGYSRGKEGHGYLAFVETQVVSPYAKFEVERADEDEGKTSCLNAATPSVVNEAKLKVEEPVLTRSIDNVKYDLENSRVYDEMVLVVAKNSATNNTQQSANLDVKLSYTDYRTSTWKTMHSLKLAMKANMDFSLPLIAEGKIDLSGEVQSRVEWGSTTTTTTILEVVHKIVVAPMTKVTVNLLATNGKCDVPFTFTQRDTLYNGTTVTTEVQGGTYTSSNYYNIAFQTKEEKI